MIMRNKNFARIIAIILAALMLFSVLLVVLNAVTASAAVSQKEIDKLKEEKKEYERRKREIQSQINNSEFERKTEVAKKSVLDDRIMLTDMEISNITETIAFYEELIEEKELEVIAAQEREDQQLLDYKERVRNMEENGVISYLEIVFDCTSFSDLLARLDFVGDIMQADERMYNDLQIAKQETEAAVVVLARTKVEMEEEKVQQEKLQAELEEQLEQANALIETIEADIESRRELYEEVEAEEEKVQREINQKVEELRRQQELERQKAAKAAGGSVKGTGVLGWPLPSSRNVTSPYGTRMHPTYKVYRKHTGIDIGGRHGASIVAADSGTVITSTYSSSYGNYVVISHGNGVTTLYAHMSSRKVSDGAKVTKGQVIGLVGSTGVSTGPHLHFEVSINGSRVNPLKYL
jgi:murein DD-endopeptidase MepM/ murein hydrolase activator NlpD